jgi:tripartite-type tricarboxylate transporter receptor subunit TctC
MLSRRHFLIGAASAPLAAQAQDAAASWPSRPVKVLVGFPPGQGSDVVARIFADDLQKTSSTPFVIENRPGAGALLAASAAAKATPDGYTLLFTSSGPFTISPHLYGKQDFDSINDLEGVALLGRSPTLLLSNHDFPATTVPEIVKLSMARELNCGSSGYGITDHLTLEMLKLKTGARLKHIPYKGSIASLTDLVGGRLDLVFASSTSSNSFVRTNRVKVVAVASADRWRAMPDVPAIAETYPGFEATSWAMMAVPRGTPDSVKQRLASMLNASMASPAVVQALATAGLEATPGTSPAAAKSYSVAEYRKWGEVIRQAKIRIE